MKQLLFFILLFNTLGLLADYMPRHKDYIEYDNSQDVMGNTIHDFKLFHDTRSGTEVFQAIGIQLKTNGDFVFYSGRKYSKNIVNGDITNLPDMTSEDAKKNFWVYSTQALRMQK